MTLARRVASRNKRSKRGKSRRTRKEQTRKATRALTQSSAPPARTKSVTPPPDDVHGFLQAEMPSAAGPVSLRNPLPFVASSPGPAMALDGHFMTREHRFFERDVSVADDFDIEPAPISVEILERRSWFRRQILRIMLALCAFTLLAMALHFLR